MKPCRVLRFLFIICLLAPSVVFAQTLIKLDVQAPATPLVVGGDPATFKAVGTFSDGTPKTFTGGLTWSSDDLGSILKIDSATGIATIVSDGSTTVRAKDPLTGTSAGIVVTVAKAPALTLNSITIAPSKVSLPAGQTTTLTVWGNYGTGQNVTTAPITSGVNWGVTADTTVATIDTKGTVSAVKAGSSTTVVVSVGGLQQTVTINATVAPSAPAPTVASPTFAISGTLNDQSKTVLINGTAGHNISIFQMPTGSSACSFAGATPLLISTSSTTTAAAVTLTNPAAPGSAPPFELALAQPLTKDSLVCAEDLGTATPATTFNWTATPTKVLAAIVTPTVPQFISKLVAGNSSLTVQGTGGDSISIYQFDPGYNVLPNSCEAADINKRTALLITTSGAAVTTSTAFPLTSNQPTGISLSQPLVVGTTICLSETATGESPNWSVPLFVADSNDFGRFRTYFTFGIQASNQLSTDSSNSSTAGQYLEVGFNSAWIRAKDREDRQQAVPALKGRGTPGLSTNIDIRLSPIPVAATATQTTTTPATGTATTTVTPNVLSSQQSARFVSSVYLPWKTTNWNNHTDFFTIGPLARGGFGTLLNPSGSSSSAGGASTTPATASTVTTTSFSSAYYFLGFGSRLAWDRYSSNTDQAPQTIAQALITFGQYSNLPSYVCNPTTVNPYATTSVITSCNQGKYAPTPATNPTNFFIYSRTVRPRIDIEGFIKLPGYPFVLGVDANLQQSAIFGRSNLDVLNKPGTEIRIFVGATLNLSTFFSKLGAPTQ
jgi:hypothetical protein